MLLFNDIQVHFMSPVCLDFNTSNVTIQRCNAKYIHKDFIYFNTSNVTIQL